MSEPSLKFNYSVLKKLSFPIVFKVTSMSLIETECRKTCLFLKLRIINNENLASHQKGLWIRELELIITEKLKKNHKSIVFKVKKIYIRMKKVVYTDKANTNGTNWLRFKNRRDKIWYQEWDNKSSSQTRQINKNSKKSYSSFFA